MIIDSVNGTNFAGTRTNELQDRSRAKIVTSFSGYINNDRIYITNGNVIYKKEPPKGQWTDCSGCLPETKVTINPDKIILTSSITGCQKECNSISIYYRPMCDFDTSTQRYLIKRFGTASDIKNFKPCKSEVLITEEKKSQQHIDDSLKTAAITVLQREQQRIKDSITNAEAAAKKRQKDIDDSIAVAKKRQQHIQDSITTANNIAKQKEQQRIQDSITNAEIAAKKRQKDIDDSITIAKKRQQHIQDSIATANNIARQKEQQRIQDSITTAEIAAKKRQKEIDDSIAIAKKREQHIRDSIATANNIARQKEQQRIQDSINAEIAAKKRQKEIDDSTAVAKKRQQHIDDSLKNAAVGTSKNPAVVTDTAKTSTSKALETRDNILLETYHIITPDILIELFDNAQVDGDRVSVYHNNSLIVSDKMLVKEPITIKIHADTSSRMHEFVMIAENLGTIPPNTALMRITAGNQVYKLSVKTDLKTNAKIIFYYDGN